MRQLLISYHRGWVAAIVASLDHGRYTPTFADPALVDPARFDAILPLRIEHYPAVRATGAHAIVPDAATVALCDDKLLLTRHFIDAGLGHLVPALLDRVTPGGCAVLKPRHGEWGEGVRIVGPGCDVPADHFLQTAIAGRTEFALHALRTDGVLRFIAVVMYEMAGDLLVRSDAHRPRVATFVDPAPFVDFARTVLDALDYRGTACINVKLDGRVPKILEINPRYGASLGADFTAYADACCAALGLD